MWCKSSLCSLPLFFYGLSAYSRPAACLGVIIILVLSILFSALDVGGVPSLDCQTQRVSKGKGWANKLLAGPCNAFLFPPSSCAFNDDECRAVWPRHNRRPSSLNFAGQHTLAPMTLTAWPPDFPGVPKQKLIGWPLDWSRPPSQIHLNHPILLCLQENASLLIRHRHSLNAFSSSFGFVWPHVSNLY